MRIRNLAAIGLLAAIATPASDIGAATFTVTKTPDTNDGTCDADCSLREAIAAANSSGGADDVSVPAGAFVLSLGQLPIENGDLTVTGAGAGSTVIDGNGSSRVIQVDPLGAGGLTVELVDLSIVNGDSGVDSGGCIMNPQDNALTLTDCIVTGCSTNVHGGGIFNAGTLTITGSAPGLASVDQNQAVAGGGIFNAGTVALDNTTIELNQAFDGGGGILNEGTLTIDDSRIVLNVDNTNFLFDLSDGSGVFQTSGTLTIRDSTVSENDGLHIGGLGGDGIGLSGGTGSVSNSTLSGNQGAGAISTVGQLTLLNTTVSGNGRFGVLAGSSGLVAVSHSTITGNTGGVQSSGAVALAHTIVAGNSGSNCSGAVVSGGHNLDDDGSCPFTGPGDLSNVADAGLGPLADHGGPTETHALLPGSPAIDAGRPPFDQRGMPLEDGDGDGVITADIGAYELPEPTLAMMLVAGMLVLPGLVWRRRRRRIGVE